MCMLSECWSFENHPINNFPDVFWWYKLANIAKLPEPNWWDLEGFAHQKKAENIGKMGTSWCPRPSPLPLLALSHWQLLRLSIWPPPLQALMGEPWPMPRPRVLFKKLKNSTADRWNIMTHQTTLPFPKNEVVSNNKTVLLLLMVQKSGVHQLRLVVYPIIYKVWYIPGGDCQISEPSTVTLMFHVLLIDLP